MNLFLSNILPRIKQFSENLSHVELFVDKPWIIIDEKMNQQKYIFKRNGQLIMSYNGEVSTGKWEYISYAQSLLIERNKNQILFNYEFFDSGIMILKKDGLKNSSFIMVNPNEIPDLNVQAYLEKLWIEKNRIMLATTNSGKRIEIHVNDGQYDYQTYLNKKVTIGGELVSDCDVRLANDNKRFIIKNGRIYRIFMRKGYKTPQGYIFIDEFSKDGYSSKPKRGNRVFDLESRPIKHGYFRLGIFKKIKVVKGVII